MPKLVIPELEALKNIPSRNRPWNDPDVLVLRSYYGHIPIAALAKHLGRSIDSVRGKAKAIGLTYDKKVYSPRSRRG